MRADLLLMLSRAASFLWYIKRAAKPSLHVALLHLSVCDRKSELMPGISLPGRVADTILLAEAE